MDGDIVAQAIDATTAAANQAIIFLVEFIEIVVEVTHGNHTLAVGVGEFHIESPLRNAGNVTAKHLAQSIAHKFHRLIFDAGAFGIGSELLLCAHMLTLLFQRRQTHAASALCIAIEQAVHHHIGIAANGRCEMGVVVESQAIVAHIGGRIGGFRHRANGKDGKHFLFGGAFCFFEHGIDAQVHLLGRTGGFHLIAKSRCNVGKIREFVVVGHIVYAIHESLRVFATLFLADMLRHLHICQ